MSSDFTLLHVAEHVRQLAKGGCDVISSSMLVHRIAEKLKECLPAQGTSVRDKELDAAFAEECTTFFLMVLSKYQFCVAPFPSFLFLFLSLSAL